MIETINILKQGIYLEKIDPPYIPKNRAKDQYGFSQRKIIKLIKGENMSETINKLQYLLTNIQNSESIHLFIHNTSKIILKKKKTEIKGYEDLRPIAIMPAMIMAFDKVIAKIIDKDIKKELSVNQHGGKDIKKEHLIECFQNYDEDRSGKIDFNEFCKILRPQNEEEKKELKILYDQFDDNGDGEIDIDEFIQGFKKM